VVGRVGVAERVPLERLKPASWNPKTIRDDRFVSLCRSIEADPAFMDEQPILAMADGTIYSGNQRYRAVEHLGWTTVPARLADIPESLAQRRGMVANNQWGDWIDDDLGALLASLGDAGTDLTLLGFEDGELERLLDLAGGDGGGEVGEDPGADLDRAAELQEKWGTSRGDLWLIGRHRLLCGDSTSAEDVARLMGGERVQGAFTSPPYAEQRKEQYGGTPADEYVSWWESIQALTASYLVEGGSFFVNIKAHCEDGERSLYVMDLVLAMKRQWGWKFVDEFCWKRNSVPGGWDNRFKNAWEPVYHFALSGKLKFNPDAVSEPTEAAFTYAADNPKSKTGFFSNRGRPDIAKPGMARPDNVIELGAETRLTEFHSAPFPVGLPSFFLSAFSDTGDGWYEPFLGSGTTMVAAEQLGRHCYGMELAPESVAVALERLAQMGLEPRRG
jgi:site-specific DNA-methyltransferase (adenine-specific)